MKKLLLPLLLSAASAYAGDVNLGMTFTAAENNAAQSAAVLYGRELGTATLRQIAVNSSGVVQTSGSSVVAVTSTTSLNPVGMLNYSVLSQTATSLNLTSVAGASVPCVVCLSSNGGPAAGFKLQFTTGATAPVVLTSSAQGHYIAASTTAQCWGPYAPGVVLHMAGSAAVSSVLVDINKVQ